MKLVTALKRLTLRKRLTLAATVLVLVATAVRARPLLNLRSNSPYCSVWLAISDAPIVIKQRRAARNIASHSRLVKRDGELDLWETPMGSYWVPTGSEMLLPTLLAQQERNVYGDADWGVRPGDIVLDCGAHVGVYSRKALSAGAKLVVAIEPSADAVECLRRNLAGEVAEGRAIIYPKGVWDHEGALTLFDNGNAAAANSFVVNGYKSKRIEQVPVTTIDQITEELQLSRVDFIKADIKGATERALLGGATVISRYRPRMALSTEEPPEDPALLARTVKRLLPGYDMKCGPCLTFRYAIFTDVVFFR